MDFKRCNLAPYFSFLIIAFVITTVSGCCLIDYTPEIKEVAVPMQNKLLTFYKKNKRHPNINERNIMLENSGCKVSKEACEFSGKSFLVKSRISSQGLYDIEISYETSQCYFGLFDNGESQNMLCYKADCIELKQ